MVAMMPYPIAVRTLPGYRIWVKYSDGIEGEVDLSHLAGRGVFTFWNEYGNFEKAYISEYRSIAWNEEIDICADTQYMKLTGKVLNDA